MAKQMHNMLVNDDEYIRIKSKKQKMVVRLNDANNQLIKEGDKLAIINIRYKKELVAKVKKITRYRMMEEISANVKKKKLGLNKNDVINDTTLGFTAPEVKIFGATGIEFKVQNFILKKIFTSILTVVVLAVILLSTVIALLLINDNSVKTGMKNVKNTKIDYMIVDMVPSYILTIVDGKVKEYGCLNKECSSINKNILVTGKTPNDAIDYLYKFTEELKFDMTKGFKVRLTNKYDINLDKYQNSSLEYIDNTTKNRLLSTLKSDSKILQQNNGEYYKSLLKAIKSDFDYGKVYECKSFDNSLECYFLPDKIEITDMSISKPLDSVQTLINYYSIYRVLNKFNIKTKINKNLELSVDLDGHIYNFNPKYEDLKMILLYKEKNEYINIIDINLINPVVSAHLKTRKIENKEEQTSDKKQNSNEPVNNKEQTNNKQSSNNKQTRNTKK